MNHVEKGFTATIDENGLTLKGKSFRLRRGGREESIVVEEVLMILRVWTRCPPWFHLDERMHASTQQQVMCNKNFAVYLSENIT